MMRKDLKNWNLLPGDRIVVPKSDLRWVQHHAIYLGRDNDDIEWISENVIGKGVRIIKLDDFLKDVIEISRIEHFRGSVAARKNAVRKALALHGSDYDLFLFNCEHYANVVQHKQVVSHQVKAGLLLGLIGLIIGFFFFLND